MLRLIMLKDASEALKMTPQAFLPLAQKAGILNDPKRGGQFLAQSDFEMILLTSEQFAKALGCPEWYLDRKFYAVGELEGVAKTIFTHPADHVCLELAIAPSDLHRMVAKGAIRSYLFGKDRYFDGRQIDALKPAKKARK